MFLQAMLSVHLFPFPRGQHVAGSFWSADTQLSKRKKMAADFLAIFGFAYRY